MPAPEHTDLVFPDSGCFGCSPSNRHGLRLTFRRRADVVGADVAIPDHFHGAPDVAHGGIVATLLDEVSCAAVAFVADHFVVTGELSVRYEQPVPVRTTLTLEARISSRAHPRYAEVGAVVRQGDRVLARSTGKFFYQERLEPAP